MNQAISQKILHIFLFSVFFFYACVFRPNPNGLIKTPEEVIPLPSHIETEFSSSKSMADQSYNNDHIIRHIEKQLSFGPRIPGSQASQSTSNYFKEFLEQYGWLVNFQEFDFDGVRLRNVVARNSSNTPQVIIGTHYDTRAVSDRDPDLAKNTLPVPGAIDGGSGSAILLELGRTLVDNGLSVWLVFFDGEDQGNINEWQWSIGSGYFAQKLTEPLPQQVVIIDMLGDHSLEIFKEKNSNTELSDAIWAIAKSEGYSESFIDIYKYAMIDDHLPFINRNIPSALLIDFDYPYWHTTSDTLDKVSIQNLEVVFLVLNSWINSLEQN